MLMYGARPLGVLRHPSTHVAVQARGV